MYTSGERETWTKQWCG
ncbi:unnamed protein product [Acanthoscelides obtectus]|uniref:Uncharacterized protein n=1 Tax=Acanthoscelides obtectus TaxID=200917 RepID=A0A9P0JYA5_ACAOB|nr:unnamed protein product [Acanthoscelides obtectus]CAK1621958.1 hypothetical protein AOBTE_LOCUS1234 [Acanthoscelides obtectus]